MKRLWVFTGPVSAAKSEGALRQIRRLQRKESNRYKGYTKGVLHIRPRKSRRVEEEDPKDVELDSTSLKGFAKTKDGNAFPCTYIDSFYDLDRTIDFREHKPDIIWLDEIHFWEWSESMCSDEYYPLVALKIAQLRKKYMVIVSGIGASSKMAPICPSMGFLLQTADRIFHYTADCDFCPGDEGLQKATRSVYIGKDKKTGKVKLGGEESFRPACPNCWFKIQNASTQDVARRIKRLKNRSIELDINN
jgi:thymidine kinase